MEKMGAFIRASPCGCDVALEAKWQRHVDPRECLRDTEVTYYIYIFIIHRL